MKKTNCHFEFLSWLKPIFSSAFFFACCFVLVNAGCGKKESPLTEIIEIERIEPVAVTPVPYAVTMDTRPPLDINAIAGVQAPETTEKSIPPEKQQAEQPIQGKPLTANDYYNKGCELFQQGWINESTEAFSLAVS